jgi:hypothetical protein
MQVSYGPPGAKGVTQLMAVGADEHEGNVTEQAVKTGGLLAVGVWGLGLLLGSRSLQNVGMGAGLALFGVQMVAGRQRVSVVKPAPGAQNGLGCIACIL